MSHCYRALIPALAAAASLMWQMPAFADPPDWAPAYGHRDHEDHEDHEDRDDRPNYSGEYRHDHDRDHDRDHEYRENRRYRGYRGDDWDDDYGVVSSGRCNTDAVLGVAGAVTGGIIGNRSASPRNRGIATVFGAIAGGIIGSAVGDAIDDGDRACMGQSFELGRVGRPVVWRNPHSRAAWRVVPLRDVSADCREFDVRRDYGGRRGHERVVACRRERGEWAFRGS